MKTIKFQYAAISAFIWVGFICAISFMEAWLKFRAPGITVPLGLGIGRLVFQALNYVEWSLVVLIFLNTLFTKGDMTTIQKITLLLPFSLLVLQTFWLLPILDERAEMHILSAAVEPSNHHFYYVGMEFIKVITISIFGLSLFTSYNNHSPLNNNEIKTSS